MIKLTTTTKAALTFEYITLIDGQMSGYAAAVSLDADHCGARYRERVICRVGLRGADARAVADDVRGGVAEALVCNNKPTDTGRPSQQRLHFCGPESRACDAIPCGLFFHASARLCAKI